MQLVHTPASHPQPFATIDEKVRLATPREFVASIRVCYSLTAGEG